MLNLVHFQPWSVMNRWQRDVEHAFNAGLIGSEPVLADNAAWMPSVDVREEADRFVVRADVPGVTAKEIEVSAEGDVLTIRGERQANERAGDNGFERIERAAGTFLRRFTLPESAQTDAIKANYRDGVLEIVIPKAPRLEAKRIEVTVN